MNKKILGIVLFIFAIFIGSIFFVANTDTQDTQISTRIKWFPYASYIGTYVAKDTGIWESMGLDVSIHEGGPQVDATKLVAAGSDDFGIAGADQLLIARSKGLKLVAIAALMQETPAGYMVHEDSDIRSMADFVNHTIRIIPGHNTDIEYRAVMKKLNIDIASVTEVVNFNELHLFLEGEVDIEPIYINNQPATADALGVKYRYLSPTDYGIRSYGNVYFTTQEMIEENPELVLKFLKGVLQGWEQAFDNPDQAVDSLMKYAPTLKKEVELDKLTRTKPLMERSDNKIGWMEHERWQEVYDVLVEADLIKYEFDVANIYDTSFVEEIYDEQFN